MKQKTPPKINLTPERKWMMKILAYTKLLLVKATLGVYLVRPIVSSSTNKKIKK